ncbi:MAG: serine hydrolase [Pseudomonadota bacterium]|nr:serine hydrolase [Pseudomonadota bacterium]
MLLIRHLPLFVACVGFLTGSAIGATSDSLNPLDIDRLVQRTMAAYQVPGIAVGIVKDGKLVFAKGYGVRELGLPGKVDADTLFGIASNTKAFTTAALAILVDEGKLHWDDKVIDYLPEFRLYDAYVTREFTIRDLVTHRSGLGLGAGDLLFWPNSDFTTKDIVHALRYLKPVSGFRAAYAYDNNLYVVAGELIPAITGQTWADFVTTRILAPLNMAPCVALPQRVSDHRNQASPHASVEGKVVPITPDDTSANAAAAAIQCNVTQLAKWQLTQLGRGLASGGLRIFSEAQSGLMWTPQTIVPPVGPWPALGHTHFDAYGLGWFLEDFNGYKRIFHSGTLGGMMTYQSLVPELNLGVIVLTNADVDEARRTIGLAITDHYTGGPKRDWVKIVQSIKADKAREHGESDAKRQPVPMPEGDLAKLDIAPYVGTFKDAWRGEASVTRAKEGLTLTFSHTKELSGPLAPIRPGFFVVRWKNRALNADAYVRFREDFAGAVEGFTMEVVTADTDFSFDFQDLDFHRVTAAATK